MPKKVLISNELKKSENELIKEYQIDIEDFTNYKKNGGKIKFDFDELSRKYPNADWDAFFLHVQYPDIDISMLNVDQIDDLLKFVHPNMNGYRRLSKKRRLKEYSSKSKSTMAARLKFCRSTVLGYSQETLGKAFYFSRSIVRDWEDDRGIVVGNLCLFAQKSSISMNYLIKKEYPLSLNTYGMDESLYNTIISMVEIYKDRNLKDVLG